MDKSDHSREREQEIHAAVKQRYRKVSVHPEGHFRYPTGRESVERLGYDPEWINRIPSEAVDRFVGVGNPFRIRKPLCGEHVLDVGCGCGVDAFVASALVGPTGFVVGMDLTAEMLEFPRRLSAGWAHGHLEFKEGPIETLPFDDGTFDLVISNAVLNLVPDKDAAFGEISRVLRAGGTFAAADLLVVETLPDDVLASMDAWST